MANGPKFTKFLPDLEEEESSLMWRQQSPLWYYHSL